MDFLIRLTEFAGNHFFLAGSFIVLATALFWLELKRGGQSISSREMTTLVNREAGIIMDVRDKKDFGRGHIVDSLHIPYASLQSRMNEIEQLKERPVVIVDALGQHSGMVGKQLKNAGFLKVFRLKSGISGWQSDGLPLVAGR